MTRSEYAAKMMKLSTLFEGIASSAKIGKDASSQRRTSTTDDKQFNMARETRLRALGEIIILMNDIEPLVKEVSDYKKLSELEV